MGVNSVLLALLEFAVPAPGGKRMVKNDTTDTILVVP
jgi:hypothetical protein